MKNKTKYSKIIHIITILVIMISFLGIYPKNIQASYSINKADLYMKGELENQYSYKGVPVFVEFTVYKKNEVEYPAYCLNRNLPGITDEREYTVNVEKEINNVNVWRAIINGYPYKTPQQLGCNSDIEAYAATKLAVYDALYTYDWSDFEKITEQGERILEAAKKIANTARSSKEVKKIATIGIKIKDEEWKIDENDSNYVSKTYKVSTTATAHKYNVTISGEDSEDIIIQDTSGKTKTTFNKTEDFKLLVPISRLDKNGSFKITVTADMETYPILYGKSPSSDFQDYALTGENLETDSVTITEKFYKNETKIKIIKKDAKTGETIQGAKFNIKNELDEIVYADLITNEEGYAIIENVTPGKYYIEEVKAPDDYVLYDGIIEIEVGLNEVYTVNVENQREEAKHLPPPKGEKDIEVEVAPEEEKETPPEIGEKEVTVTSKALPRTGY